MKTQFKGEKVIVLNTVIPEDQAWGTPTTNVEFLGQKLTVNGTPKDTDFKEELIKAYTYKNAETTNALIQLIEEDTRMEFVENGSGVHTQIHYDVIYDTNKDETFFVAEIINLANNKIAEIKASIAAIEKYTAKQYLEAVYKIVLQKTQNT